MTESGWFCKETQQTVCEDHVEVDWEGYGEYEGEMEIHEPEYQ